MHLYLYGFYDLNNAYTIFSKLVFSSINSFKNFNPPEIDFRVQCEIQV